MKNPNKKENNPNPSRLIQSLRHLGYDNYGAICDLIDNSIDADAKNIYISIGMEHKQFAITIADDGCGMNAQVLDQAVRLGSLTDRDPNSDLGKFGMGLSTASLSLAKRTEVLTKTSGGGLFKSIIDVDDIVASNTFSKEEGEAESEDQSFFKRLLQDAASGTIVSLRKCDNIKNENVTIFANTLRKEVERIFRLFLGAGRNIIINDIKCELFDPLMLNLRDTEILCDEDFSVEAIIAGKRIDDIIRVKLVRLPLYTQEENKEKGINIRNQGFYILRNQREIAAGVSLEMFVKHPNFNRVRGEIYFSGLLDDLVGVNFTKKNISFSKMLWDRINAIVAGHLRESRARNVKEQVIRRADSIKHEVSEQQISKKSKLLVTPPPEKKISTGTEKKPETEKQPTLKKPIETSEPTRTEIGKIVSKCRFEQATLGRLGPIYNAYPEGKKLVIQLNIEHPFYERFYLAESTDNPDLQCGMDFLIYSMASAEQTVLSGQEEESIEMMENLKIIMSNNLRILLV